jgi:PAS domain S-box-containing protein
MPVKNKSNQKKHTNNDRLKQARDTAQDKEATLQSIFRAAPIGIGMVSNRVIKRANDRLCEMLGYSPAELIDQSAELVYPSREEFEWVGKEKYNQIRKRGFGTVETRWQCKDGTVLEILLSSAPLDPEDLEAGVTFTALDITRRKRTENALRETSEKYKELADSLPQIVFETDIEGNITFTNQNAFNLIGYNENELKKGINALQLMIPEDHERARQNIKRVLRGEQVPDSEYTALRKDGGTFPIIVHAVRIIHDNKPAGMRGIIIDLTERKQAEDRLHESEERFRTALEANPDPFVLYDMEGRVIFFNPAFTRLFGWTLEEQLGKKMDQFVPEKSWLETRKMVETVMAGKRLAATETNCYTKDGKLIPVIISGASYLDRDGLPAGTIINLRDISEQKRLQSQLQKAQRMEAIGTLAGGIAHDFNNILSAILGYTEIAISDAAKDSELDHNLRQVLNAGGRAKDLVKQILTFSRQAEQELKPVQIKIAVKEALKLIRASLPTTIDIQQNITSDSVVLADLTQIHQVVMNLCTNASHAMQAEGGTLTINLVDSEINADIAAEHPGLIPGSYIKLSVIDTGHGMSPNLLNRIFDPFFTTKEKGEGTGMGLAVVHGIVKSYGGEIIVQSQPGKGTIFDIYFPVIEKVEFNEIRTVPFLPVGNERVLFVDDEPSLVNIGKQILERLGYEVVTRTSSLEALELFKIKSQKFDLVITDMTMPGMTGEQLAAEIIKIRPDMPIILCTGYSKNMSEDKAKGMGIRALAMKPVVADQLANIVRNVLDETREPAS